MKEGYTNGKDSTRDKVLNQKEELFNLDKFSETNNAEEKNNDRMFYQMINQSDNRQFNQCGFSAFFSRSSLSENLSYFKELLFYVDDSTIFHFFLFWSFI